MNSNKINIGSMFLMLATVLIASIVTMSTSIQTINAQNQNRNVAGVFNSVSLDNSGVFNSVSLDNSIIIPCNNVNTNVIIRGEDTAGAAGAAAGELLTSLPGTNMQTDEPENMVKEYPNPNGNNPYGNGQDQGFEDKSPLSICDNTNLAWIGNNNNVASAKSSANSGNEATQTISQSVENSN